MILNALLTVALAQGPAPALDFSGVRLFWRVHDLLVLDREPPPELWDSLFATPGYAALEARERRRARITRAIQLAFRPSEQPAADSVVQAGGWVAGIIPHLRKIPGHRRQLDSIVARWEAGPPWAAAALASARQYLPASAWQGLATPSVSFLFFAPDGRGYPALTVADLLHTLTTSDPERFFAHEFHHFYRHKLSREGSAPAGPFSDLVDLLVNTEFEGVADQLDKRWVPGASDQELLRLFPDSSRRAYYRNYRAEFAAAGRWLAAVDSVLVLAPEPGDTVIARIRRLRDALPDGGRVLGAYMAATIERLGGRAVLVSVVGNSGAFWAAYQEAATACAPACPMPSLAAMQVLRRLLK